MGTFFTISLWSDNYINEKSIKSDVLNIFNLLDSEISNWREDSWINQFNQSPSDIPVKVPDHAFEILHIALQIAEKSNGLLDPTLGPLIDLWGFGPKRKNDVPDESLIQQTLSKVGYKKLIIDMEKRTLIKTHENLQLNLSAIAKGYAVDIVSIYLSQKGIENYLINIGGEISAKGHNINNNAWTVGINIPKQIQKNAHQITQIQLFDQCLATSGHDQKNFKKEGKIYSHIFDPGTGYPVTIKYSNVSVTAPNCAVADGIATLGLIMTEADLQKFLMDYPGVEVFRFPAQ